MDGNPIPVYIVAPISCRFCGSYYDSADNPLGARCFIDGTVQADIDAAMLNTTACDRPACQALLNAPPADPGG